MQSSHCCMYFGCLRILLQKTAQHLTSSLAIAGVSERQPKGKHDLRIIKPVARYRLKLVQGVSIFFDEEITQTEEYPHRDPVRMFFLRAFERRQRLPEQFRFKLCET